MKFLYLVLLSCLAFQFSLAQSPPGRCAMDHMQALLAAESPEYARSLEAYIDQLGQPTHAVDRSAALFNLPVVVHVIHMGEQTGVGSNLSESRILSQLDILNEDYRRANADAANTPGQFAGLAADVDIEFCLARLDPFDNPTSGITRHQYLSIPNLSYIEQNIKPATTWDPSRYINIWTVAMPPGNGNVLGYSYLPTPQIVGSERDGLVIDHNHFGYVSFTNKGRTTTHEMGHYLGLLHTWGGNDTNGIPIGCNSDDGVADTPNASGPYYECPVFGQSSCGSVDMNMNFMDYVDDHCMNLFTAGQADRIRSTLNGIRSSLLDEANNICNTNNECTELISSDLNSGFENSAEIEGWVIEDANGDATSWNLGQGGNDDWGPNSGSGLAVYLWNEDAVTAAHDYLFSPCFQIEEGRSYELLFSIANAEDANGNDYPERLEVGFSSLQSAADFFSPTDWNYNPFSQSFPNYQNERLLFQALETTTISIGFHVFSSADMYAMQLDDISIRDLGTVGADEPQPSSAIGFYPNPLGSTSELLTIELAKESTDEAAAVHWYDVNGRLLGSQAVLPGTLSLQIDLSEMKAGIYFVCYQSAIRHWTRRLIKVAK